MFKRNPDNIKRANEELEDLLRQNFANTPTDRLSERGDEAQRPLQRLLSTPDSGTERLLGSGDWQASTNSSQKAGEPSLLGSGWSWQTPRDVQEFLTTSSLNNTADSETLRGKMSISSVRTGQTSDDTRWHSGSLMTSTNPADRVGSDQRPEGERSGPSSRFSTSASESGDDWTASDEDEMQLNEPIPVDSIIGRGAFGSVYRTTWKGRQAALKVIEHDDELGQNQASDHEEVEAASEDELDSFARGTGEASVPLPQTGSTSLTATQADQALLEAAMSSAVHHPNVVQTYHYRTVLPRDGLTSSDSASRAVRETHIVMEFCDCGSLEDAVSDGRLADVDGADVDLEKLCMTLLEVARAMEYLHKMHITHRDLKLANVLLKTAQDDLRGFTAKVSDFGLSRLLPDQSPKFRSSNPEYTGTITHMAPELLEHGGMSRAADVYSFGILMWEALMGESAYQGISKMQVMFGVVSEDLRPRFPPNTPPWYAQIATACWRKDAKRRPSFAKICHKLGAQLADLRAALQRHR